MRMKLVLLLLLISVSGLAIAEQPLLRDQTDQLNYSMGYHLGQKVHTLGLAFEPDTLWQSLNDGLGGREAQATENRSYKLGYDLGGEIVKKQLEFRAEALWQGLYDLMDHAQPRLKETEMTLLLEQIRGTKETVVVAAPAEPVKPSGPPPKVYRLPGQKFLAENSDGEDVVTLSSGLQYRVLASGKGDKPKGNDSVLVNYLATSIEGKVFSTTAQMGIPTPKEYKVNKLIPGLTQALRMMREGDRWELYIPTNLAFKDTGPMAGQTVIYDLELVEVLPEFR